MKKEEMKQKLKEAYGDEFEKLYSDAMKKYGKERKALNSLEIKHTVDSAEGYVVGWINGKVEGGSLILRTKEGNRYINFMTDADVEKQKVDDIPDYAYVKFSNLDAKHNMLKDKVTYSIMSKTKYSIDPNAEKYVLDVYSFGDVLGQVVSDDDNPVKFKNFDFLATVVAVWVNHSDERAETTIKLLMEDDEGTRMAGKVFAMDDGAADARKDFITELADITFDEIVDTNAQALQENLNIELKNMDVLVRGWIGTMNGNPFIAVSDVSEADDLPVETRVVRIADTSPTVIISQLLLNEPLSMDEIVERVDFNKKDVKKVLDAMLMDGMIYENNGKYHNAL